MPDGLSNLANCQTVSYQMPAQKARGKKPDTTEVRCQFASAVEALQIVIQQERPDILAFGETHPKQATNAKPTTLTFFAEQLLPSLQQSEYYDLVVEGLLSDLTSKQQATDYLASKLPVTALEQNYFFPPKTKESVGLNNNGLIKLFETAKALSTNSPLRIYGGGPSLQDPEKNDIYENPLWSISLKPDDHLQRQITERTINVTLARLDQGAKRVIIYSGGNHNDLTGRPQKNSLSYGSFFRKKTPFRYVEFDILTPELMDKGHFAQYGYQEYKNWLRSAVPQKGATLLRRGSGSYTMILPSGILAP
jgi:hypothetical protein